MQFNIELGKWVVCVYEEPRKLMGVGKQKSGKELEQGL